MELHAESRLLRVYWRTVVMQMSCGPFENNAFVLVDKGTGDAAIIDAVAQHELVMAGVEESGATPKMVLFTHSHPDHIKSYHELRERLGPSVPFYMHTSDTVADEQHPWLESDLEIDIHMQGGETILLGGTELEVMHTPGHTTGSVSYFIADADDPYCVVGDTLFPGGPGQHARNAAGDTGGALDRDENSTVLPEHTLTFNGHGDDTTIGASIDEFVAGAMAHHDCARRRVGRHRPGVRSSARRSCRGPADQKPWITDCGSSPSQWPQLGRRPCRSM